MSLAYGESLNVYDDSGFVCALHDNFFSLALSIQLPQRLGSTDLILDEWELAEISQ